MSSLRSRIAAIIARVTGWFRRAPSDAEPAMIALPAPPQPAPPPVAPDAAPQPKRDDTVATFHFRGSVLDQLDRYFRLLRRMRDGDKEAYDLHGRIGAFIVPRKAWHDFSTFSPEHRTELAPIWRTVRPSFGMIMFGAAPDHAKHDAIKDTWLPAAIYFRKYDRAGVPPTIQPTGAGDVYAVTVYWDKIAPLGNRRERRRHRTGVPTEFPIVINAAGEVGLLKTRDETPIIQREKHGPNRGKTFEIPRRRWKHSDFFVDWARSHEMKVDAYLASLFIDAANIITEAAMSVIRVRVQHGGLAAAFAVDVLRTPYFFRDRDATITASGAKRPIFHIVRTHERQLANGRQSFVRTHFRGERAFRWNGYNVEITVPGRDHFALFDVDFGAYDEDKTRPGEDVLDTRDIGAWMRRQEKAGLGAMTRH